MSIDFSFTQFVSIALCIYNYTTRVQFNLIGWERRKILRSFRKGQRTIEDLDLAEQRYNRTSIRRIK